MKRFKVRLENGYSVLLGNGISDGIVGYLEEEGINGVKKIMIVSDGNVFPLYGEKLSDILLKAGYEVSSFVFPAGYYSKNIGQVEQLWERLGDREFTHSDLIISLGGDVTADISAFAASTYLMGLRYIHMPTTLLSMADCRIGGVNHISLKHTSSLVGTVWHPSLIICDTAFLQSLPQEVFNQGMAEVIKYAMIDADEIRELIMKDEPDIEKVLALCIYSKKEKYESGNEDRIKLLQLGYTVADALQELTGKQVSRGDAVAMGLVFSTEAAIRKGLCRPDARKILNEVLAKYSIVVSFDHTLNYEPALHILKEKRRLGDTVKIVIPRKFGECFVMDVSIKDFEDFLSGNTIKHIDR